MPASSSAGARARFPKCVLPGCISARCCRSWVTADGPTRCHRIHLMSARTLRSCRGARLPSSPINSENCTWPSNMTVPKITDLKAFVPARDFALSRQFYLELGFVEKWGNDEVCELELSGFRFLLQNFYVKEHAE